MSCIPGSTYRFLYDTPIVMPVSMHEKSMYSKHQRILDEVQAMEIEEKQSKPAPEPKKVMGYEDWRKIVLIFSAISIILQTVLGVTSIVEGVKTESSGTLGFGLETMMDIATTVVIIWRFYGGDISERKEFRSVVVLAVLLMVLAIGTAVGATYNLLQEFKPFKEYRLMIICCIGFCLYTILGWMKIYLADKVESKAMFIDGISTLFAAITAVALLASLIVYKLTKLWFLDGVVALLIALIMSLYAVRTLYKDVYLVQISKRKYSALEEISDEIEIENNNENNEEKTKGDAT